MLDIRSGNARLALGAALGALNGRGIRPQIFFLEASDEALIRRFSETRHRHPLETDHRGIATAIERERQVLDEVRGMAQVIIDTSGLSQRQLRERITSALESSNEPDQVTLQIISFGFKHGVPLESDLVFDVRFMENPFYVPELKALTGLDPAGPAIRAHAAHHRTVPVVPARLLCLHHPGVPGGGQDASHDGHRLHRRRPPFGRHR